MAVFEGKRFHFDIGKRTYVMGILNVTPDSFSDGGQFFDPETAIRHALLMQQQGADIIDIGAESTRPGHIPVSPEEEQRRLQPILRTLCETLDIPVSVDTLNPETADWALSEGVAIINDVSGVFVPEMAEAVLRHDAGWIITHGADADSVTASENVSDFFSVMLKKCRQIGIPESRICLDPGIGFGKSRAEDYSVLRNLQYVYRSGCALLVGASRKRLIGEASGESDPQKRLAGTVACHTAAVAGGADILRVHDVFEGVQGARVADALYRTEKKTNPGKIILSDLNIYAYHGVNPEEKQFGQTFLVDAELTTDFTASVAGDRIEDTVSYAKVAKTLIKVLTSESYDLIETAAETAANAIMFAYPSVQSLRLRLKKPDAPMKAQFGFVAVEVTKERSL